MVAIHPSDGSGYSGPYDSGPLTLDPAEIDTQRMATADILDESRRQRLQQAHVLRVAIARQRERLGQLQDGLDALADAIVAGDREYWRLTATMEPTLDEIRALHAHAAWRARALVDMSRLRGAWQRTHERMRRLAQAERRVSAPL